MIFVVFVIGVVIVIVFVYVKGVVFAFVIVFVIFVVFVIGIVFVMLFVFVVIFVFVIGLVFVIGKSKCGKFFLCCQEEGKKMWDLVSKVSDRSASLHSQKKRHKVVNIYFQTRSSILISKQGH